MISDRMHFDTTAFMQEYAIWKVDSYNIRSVYWWSICQDSQNGPLKKQLKNTLHLGSSADDLYASVH